MPHKVSDWSCSSIISSTQKKVWLDAALAYDPGLTLALTYEVSLSPCQFLPYNVHGGPGSAITATAINSSGMLTIFYKKMRLYRGERSYPVGAWRGDDCMLVVTAKQKHAPFWRYSICIWVQLVDIFFQRQCYYCQNYAEVRLRNHSFLDQHTVEDIHTSIYRCDDKTHAPHTRSPHPRPHWGRIRVFFFRNPLNKTTAFQISRV